MRLPVMWAKVWLLTTCLFVSFGFAAPPGQGTLGAQLALEQTPGLDVTLRESDATTASYAVSAPENVPAVAEAVKAYLVAFGLAFTSKRQRRAHSQTGRSTAARELCPGERSVRIACCKSRPGRRRDARADADFTRGPAASRYCAVKLAVTYI